MVTGTFFTPEGTRAAEISIMLQSDLTRMKNAAGQSEPFQPALRELQVIS